MIKLKKYEKMFIGMWGWVVAIASIIVVIMIQQKVSVRTRMYVFASLIIASVLVLLCYWNYLSKLELKEIIKEVKE